MLFINLDKTVKGGAYNRLENPINKFIGDCFIRRFTFARIDISYARFFSTKARKKYYHMRV